MEKLAQKLGLGVDILSEALMNQIWIDFTSLMLVLTVGLLLTVSLGVWAYNEEEPFGIFLATLTSAIIIIIMVWQTITIIYNPIYYAISLIQ